MSKAAKELKHIMAEKKSHFGGLFWCQISTLSNSAPVPSVSEPFSVREHGGGRGWKQGNWDQSVPHSHYQFFLDNASTFPFHPRNGGGRLGFHRGTGRSKRWWTWKLAPFPPPSHSELKNVVSYLVRVWHSAMRIFKPKYIQPFFCLWFHHQKRWAGIKEKIYSTLRMNYLKLLRVAKKSKKICWSVFKPMVIYSGDSSHRILFYEVTSYKHHFAGYILVSFLFCSKLFHANFNYFLPLENTYRMHRNKSGLEQCIQIR